MSEQNATAVQGETQATSKPRAKGVSQKVFIETHKAGVDAGKTVGQIAADLGMNKASYTSRASQVRAKYREIGLVFPKAKGERTSRSEDLLAELGAALHFEAIPAKETPADGETAPAEQKETAQS